MGKLKILSLLIITTLSSDNQNWTNFEKYLKIQKKSINDVLKNSGDVIGRAHWRCGVQIF